jgi:hypothetical protein
MEYHAVRPKHVSIISNQLFEWIHQICLYYITVLIFSCFKHVIEHSVCNTPDNNNNRFGGVTTLQDNKKTKAIDI